MRKLEKQWTLAKGVETKEPVMWSSREEVIKHKELKRELRAALTISYEYTYDDDYSATPDTDDYSVTSCEATSQYEVTDEALPGTTTTSEKDRRVNKAMFHIEHLRHELNSWYSTAQKH